jgi:hypothetical protein
MLKKILFKAFLLFTVMISMSFWLLRGTDLHVQAAYRHLVTLHEQTKENQSFDQVIGYQNRQKVTKQIFYNDNHERLQIYLQSPQSFLQVENHGGKPLFVEHFQDLSCTMQEPKETVRHLHAEQATYFYHTLLLEAKNVEIERYASDLSTLLMRGHAKNLSLSLLNQSHFLAEGFEMSLCNGDGL